MGTVEPGMKVTASVGEDRLDTMRNHTATHLLNWALREVLDPKGETVQQAGSVVAPDRLRFDFTYGKSLTSEQLNEIERLVNGRILHDGQVMTKSMPLDEAMKVPGVRAVFGEKYPDPVRVVKVGGTPDTDVHEYFSAEFCGGTHLDRAGRVGLFKIISEESVARGVRRITAITGNRAVKWVLDADRVLRNVSESLSVPPEEVSNRIESMQKELKRLRKQSALGNGEISEEQELETPFGRVVVAMAGSADPGVMRSMCDQQRQKGAAAVFVGGADEETKRVMMVAMVDDRLVESGKLLAGDWVREIAPIVGGGGGGKPRLAQAGGKQPEKLSEALAGALQYAGRQLEE
jgi:alanyl-tRNA synthetase